MSVVRPPSYHSPSTLAVATGDMAAAFGDLTVRRIPIG